MRAVIGRRFGGIDDLVYDDAPAPVLEPGTIRIAVHAAGVSFANLLFIAGKHQNRPNIPFVPGTEIGGIVSEIASETAAALVTQLTGEANQAEVNAAVAEAVKG